MKIPHQSKKIREGKSKKTKSWKITETALKCGFSSVHAFSKAFKQKRGLSPGAYMEMIEDSNNSMLEKVDYNPQKQIYFNQ